MFFSFASFSQKKPNKDSVSISFLFNEQAIADSAQLTLKVIYKNKTNRPVDIYRLLSEGNPGDRFYNIFIEMQKLDSTEYNRHSMRTYQNSMEMSMEDSLRHYDVAKKKLAPFRSDTLSINFMDIAGVFPPGKYRFKAHLRVKTIRDNSIYNDPDFETIPPLDKPVYIASKWFYFTITKHLQVSYHVE